MPNRGAIHSAVSRANTPGFLSLEHAAEYADVSIKTMQRWIGRGLPKYQAGPGSKVLIRATEIEAFLTKSNITAPDLTFLVDEVVKEIIPSRTF